MSFDIIKSWETNADEWIQAIDLQQIPSRKFTNAAITNVLEKLSSSKVLDMGCEEGWLTRSLTKIGKTAIGINAIGHLLENAKKKGPESFYQLSFEDILNSQIVPQALMVVMFLTFASS